MLQILPASRFASNSIAPRAANASLGTTSAPFWCFRPAWIWCFRPAWNYAPGHAYWKQDPEQSLTKNARLPTASWDLVQLCRRSQGDVRGTAFRLPALDQDRFTAPAPRVRARMPRARGYSVLPLPRGNRRLSMDFFCRDYFSSSCIQTAYMGLTTGV